MAQSAPTAMPYLHPAPWKQDFAPLSLHDMFFGQAAKLDKAPLLHFLGRRFSYAELADEARHVAKGLQQLGLKQGDRVGLFLPNVPHYITAYYGALAAGAVVVNFSPLYTVDELAHQVADSGTTILVTVSAAALLPTALKVLEQSSLQRLIVGGIAEALRPVKSLAYRLFKRDEIAQVPDDPRLTRYAKLIRNDAQFFPQCCDPIKDVALLQYTGGTTGVPKGAKLTHQNITANARQVNLIDPHSRANNPSAPEADRILGGLPFFHVFANTTVLNRTVDNGGEIIALPRFNAGDALAALDRRKATSMPGVPTMYQALLDNPALSKTDFTTLRACISGGAPLSAELKARFERTTGARMIEGYGLTESAGVISANPYEALNKAGSIGQPIPGTEVKLVDKEDPTRPPVEGEAGELLCRGPQIMAGYWNRPDADAEVFVNGWLRTGDVARIDEDGFIFIVDRLKDMIAVGGFKVFPSQIEEVLYTHEGVKECLVIGVPDAYLGERPRAYVTLNSGVDASSETLTEWINARIGKHERVDQVVIRTDMPKTMIGKLDRKALRAQELG